MLRAISSEELLRGATTQFSDALERGEILFFPKSPVPLPSEEERNLLRSLENAITRKNPSYYLLADRTVGIDPSLPGRELVHAVLRRHLTEVLTFLETTMPGFAKGLRPGTCSFRPKQAAGRVMKPRAADDLVHIDAGAYGATHGDRILRFFVNLNPSEPRIWSTRGTLPTIYARYGRKAGVAEGASESAVRDGALDRAWTWMVGKLSRAGLPKARMLDSSRYDRRMRRLHNYMKEAPEFRNGKDGLEQFEFPPNVAWMVLTDMVSHACLSGQHALVSTFIVPLQNCRLRQLSPYAILQRPPEVTR